MLYINNVHKHDKLAWGPERGHNTSLQIAKFIHWQNMNVNVMSIQNGTMQMEKEWKHEEKRRGQTNTDSGVFWHE